MDLSVYRIKRFTEFVVIRYYTLLCSKYVDFPRFIYYTETCDALFCVAGPLCVTRSQLLVT